MSQRREKARESAETIAAPTSTADNAPPIALSSSLAHPASVDDFDPEDRAVLSLIALCAVQCTTARSAERVLDALFASSSSASPAATTEEPTSLLNRYPEVLVLRQLHNIRCALRNLQSCAPPARRTFFALVEKHMTALAQVLPDPLFLAIAAVLQDLLGQATDDALAKRRCHVLEVQLLRMVEVTQMELLRVTKQLSVRAGVITLRFHHDIPYL